MSLEPMGLGPQQKELQDTGEVEPGRGDCLCKRSHQGRERRWVSWSLSSSIIQALANPLTGQIQAATEEPGNAALGVSSPPAEQGRLQKRSKCTRPQDGTIPVVTTLHELLSVCLPPKGPHRKREGGGAGVLQPQPESPRCRQVPPLNTGRDAEDRLMWGSDSSLATSHLLSRALASMEALGEVQTPARARQRMPESVHT